MGRQECTNEARKHMIIGCGKCNAGIKQDAVRERHRTRLFRGRVAWKGLHKKVAFPLTLKEAAIRAKSGEEWHSADPSRAPGVGGARSSECLRK